MVKIRGGMSKLHGKIKALFFSLFMGLTAIRRLSCSLLFSATQDADEPEIQPVSEPEKSA